MWVTDVPVAGGVGAAEPKALPEPNGVDEPNTED